jgi:hypothetical protein
VIPRRQPVAPPEVLATPEGAAIAGWEQLTVELSAGSAGLRVAIVVLDATGQPISASGVGGRLESDGTFRGTRWRTVGFERADGGDPQLESTPSEPSAADVTGLKALVADVLRRAAPAIAR